MRRHITNSYPDGRNVNITRLLIDRQYRDIEQILKSRLQTARPFVQRLELETELLGHSGCVNCLEWSSDGRMLASGSDDCHVLFWDPFRHKKLKDLPTPHRGNIFSLKFIPQTDNSTIVTGAGDSRIYGFDLNHYEPIFRCNCHQGRVKRLAVAKETPHIFFSASEDGSVFQFDLRESHNCQNEESIVLIDLKNHSGRFAEVKCISVNPQRPELVAIGSNDGYARLYDRRMIKLDQIRTNYEQGIIAGNRQTEFYEDNVPKNGCVTYFAPGHLARSCGTSQRAATYLAFSPSGRELLVNIGAEQIYLYDIYSTKQPKYLDLPPLSSVQWDAKRPKLMISDEVDQMKQQGNDLLDKEKYTEAINQYSLAIQESPKYAALYLNRATALMKRKWRGDLYASLIDCQRALKLDPGYVKAQFRMTRALLELEYVQEAQECLNEIRSRFPDYANNHGVLMLNKDIETALEKKETNGNGTTVTELELSENEKVGSRNFWVFGFNFFFLMQYWRSLARDYKERFVGHCNTKTDIKEANFFGSDGKYVVAG